MHSTHLAPAIVVPFVLWRVYSRMRRNVGRQLLRPKRMLAAVVIFGLVSLVFGFVALGQPLLLAALAGGLLAGALFSLVGLRLTRFEQTADGHFYTPNAYIGVSLTLLLFGRMIYRLGVLFSTPMDTLASNQQAFQSPLTLVIFGVTAGYYIAYYSGVLWRLRTKKI
jgi:hypothetical protein